MSETDVEFLERMKLQLVWTAPDETLVADIKRLFSLARRGAEMDLVKQKLVIRDGSEWVQETYFRERPLPAPERTADE
jgi:hypothetical protein